jgi:hypothetical protein
MRRISLAVALVSAVAAGCGVGNKPSSTSGEKGTAGVNFDVKVNNQGPGTVTANPGALTCAANSTCTWTFTAGTTVVLAAAPTGTNYFNGWFGGCSGTGTCTLTGQADKYVVSYFSETPQAHPTFNDVDLHAGEFAKFVNAAPGALQCTKCHGAQLQGLGMGISCGTCHSVPARDPIAFGGHFDGTKEPWSSHTTGWDQACQRCHTNGGFLDFIGADGAPNLNAVYPLPLQSDARNKTPPAAITFPTDAQYANGPLKCSTCHNATAKALRTITFPSGKKVTTDASTAICGQCHGARESTASVNAKILATAADVAISPAQGFINPHYLGGAATVFGADAQGWAQYPNMVYTAANKHGGVASCTYCHDAHDGSLPKDSDIEAKCGKCHFDEAGQPVKTILALEEVRQFGFEGDIDGDGIEKSLKLEIDGLAAKMYQAMQAYARDVVGTPIVYTDAYPYFMNATTNAAYAKIMTPRLLRATYNYKWYKADPGAWAHNPRYAIEVLYDALFDLNAGLKAAAKPTIDVTGVRRSFNGHFGAAGFAVEPYAQFLYHPAAGSPFGTPGPGFSGNTCFQCHGGQGGLEAYLSRAPVAKAATSDCIGAAPCVVAAGGQPDPVSTPGTYLTFQNRVTGMQCSTCHLPVDATTANFKGLRTVDTLFVMPQKGAVGTNGVVSYPAAQLPASFALCGTCHTGLENQASVDQKIAAMADATKFTASFVNGHYFGAAGIILGSEANVLYQYASKTYQGKAVNWSVGTANGPHGSPHGARCAGCHDAQQSKHSFEIDTATTVVKGTYQGAANTKACDGCHIDARAFGAGDYRLAPPKANLAQLGADLLVAIKAYAVANNAGNAVCYTATAYPYFLKDLNGNGVCDAPTETARTNAYTFDAKLLKAAYNYQWFVKDPGAAEHNYIYIGQVLFDSIEDLGGTTTVARPVSQ